MCAKTSATALSRSTAGSMFTLLTLCTARLCKKLIIDIAVNTAINRALMTHVMMPIVRNMTYLTTLQSVGEEIHRLLKGPCVTVCLGGPALTHTL